MCGPSLVSQRHRHVTSQRRSGACAPQHRLRPHPPPGRTRRRTDRREKTDSTRDHTTKNTAFRADGLLLQGMLPKISRYSTAITLMMRVWEPSRSMPCAVCVCVRGILKDLCGEGKGQLQGGSARIALHRLFGVRTMEDSEELDRGRQLRMTRLVEQAVHRGAQGEPEERLSAGRFRGGDPGKRDGRDESLGMRRMVAGRRRLRAGGKHRGSRQP